MTTIQFLAEWTLRSSILILSGTLLLWALRVKDPSIRLAAWTAMLCGSLAIPLLTAALPKLPLVVTQARVGRVEAPVAIQETSLEAATTSDAPVSKPFDWARAAVTMYFMVTLALLLRLCAGLALGLRLLRNSPSTGRTTEGIEIRESDQVAAPVTLGVARPAIVLPLDWRQWDASKLEAVLAHERAHVRRFDPAVQLLSAIHRALLWHSPLSWFLHQRIVRVAEEASDDAALAIAGDRAWYAEVLLDFMRRGVRGANWLAVPMARYGRPDARIHRILDATTLSCGVTRWSVAAILAIGSPLAYVVAAAQPQSRPPAQAATAAAAPAPPFTEVQVQSTAAQAFLTGIGNVAPLNTVTVKPRIDGQLKSVDFKEGETVQAGQVLASLDPRPYEIPLAAAESQLEPDLAAVNNARVDLDRYQKLVAQNAIPKDQLATPIATVAQLEARVKMDQANIDRAKLQLSYTQILSPITGVAGLRLVDAGNMVHAADATGIVIVTQLQPIAVLFTIPEDSLPRVDARLRQGAILPVEAWNRANTARIATGRLTAVDNRIDEATGMAKLKAVFDNKDGALIPGQFVNVRLFENAR